ncbi:DUF1269 domain-containing protein [Siminovitchia sp. FSL W7-1587]|uniref:DUF1269 domain-containing protein n=1 Tax=Siminovitchia sp. FSL W7-1587 TaxID=2954699 RepID=UPI0030D09392
MENVVVTFFDEESEAFQALAELKQKQYQSNDFALSQVVILKKENEQIVLKDGFDTGVHSRDDTLIGGLIGSLVGVLGGPLGVLLGFGAGAAIGAIVDINDLEEESSLIAAISSRLQDNDVAIVLVMSDEYDAVYDDIMSKFSSQTRRYEASMIREEVEHAREIEMELQKQAREKLREERSAERKAKVKSYRDRIRAEVEDLKRKFKSV